jgi:hypothetical protein
MRAAALAKLGRTQEAEAEYRLLLEKEPQNVRLKIAMVWTAIANLRATDDLRGRAELCRYVAQEIASCETWSNRFSALQLLNVLGATEEAAALLSELVDAASSIKEMASVFELIPHLIDRGSRAVLWHSLLSRAAQLSKSAGKDSDAAAELELRLLVALERFGPFVEKFQEYRDRIVGRPLFAALNAAWERLQRPRHLVFQEAKVFGIGLSKTGTKSLAEALNLLGIDAAHWTNPVTGQLLSEMDIFLFGGCTDVCIAQDFEKLYFQYPNARFIWTKRPFVSWAASFIAHHRKASWAKGMDELRNVYDGWHCPHMFANAAIEFGLFLNHADLAEAYEIFERRVRTFFADKPGGKLLQFDLFAGDSWSKLCGFLSCDIPSEPFPFLNRSRSSEARTG